MSPQARAGQEEAYQQRGKQKKPVDKNKKAVQCFHVVFYQFS
ncbi:hypothetical protein [[Clostridium] scindens]|nr:hypothetical protein [[Clostridium] scindens]